MPNQTDSRSSVNIEKLLTSTGIKEAIIAGEESYSVKFLVPVDFGEIAAFLIRNNHPNEFYLHILTLEIGSGVTYEFPCNSWVYNDNIYHDDRVSFSNTNYLPSQTPPCLKRELTTLRGDGHGFRHDSDRLYDYAVYNDLGIPDLLLNRPPLGGSQNLSHPRGCRTTHHFPFNYSMSLKNE